MKVFFISLVVASFCSIPVIAQPPGQMGPRNQHAVERLERYKKVRMLEALHLDEETGLKLVARYNRNRTMIKEFETDRSTLIDKLNTQVRTNADEKEFQKTFDALIETENMISESRKKYLDELKEIFTNKQIAEYMIFERDFMHDLRGIVKDVQRERQRKK